jgi:hypothetical protein
MVEKWAMWLIKPPYKDISEKSLWQITWETKAIKSQLHQRTQHNLAKVNRKRLHLRGIQIRERQELARLVAIQTPDKS